MPKKHPVESHPGSYALILQALRKQDVQIGQLGQLAARLGFYVYVGSAFGPGGVRTRVRHHTKISKRPHWHIDYLRQTTQLKQVWYTHDPLRPEHVWADVFATAQGASIPLPGFGASDCTCISHLYFFQRRPSLKNFRLRIRIKSQKNAPLVVSSLYDL